MAAAVTPLTFVAQQRAARAAQAARPAVRFAYTTRTGDAPRPGPDRLAADLRDLLDEAHCFVCGRHTDHAGEHDALVEAGLAYYTTSGSVHRTDIWDPEKAAAVARDEYLVLCLAYGL